MNSVSGQDADWKECLVRLIGEKSGNGVGWVVEMMEAERAADSRSLDCGMTTRGQMPGMTTGHETVAMTSASEMEELRAAEYVIPWMEAGTGPCEKWWERMRGNPKRLGEVSQAAFLLRAETLGFNLALPWGDSERYDFVVWGRKGGRIYRVQVKGTGRLHRRGYEVQPVHSTRGRGKKRYTKEEIDVIAAHVQPLDIWYLLPIEKIGRAKSLRFYPDIKSRWPMWEKYREAWEVLGRE